MLQKQQALISGNTFNTATLKSAATAARQHMHTRRASRVVHGLVLLLLPLLLPPLLLFLLLLVALLGRRLAAELVDAALGEPRRVLEIQEGGVSVSMPRGQRRGRQRAGGCLPPRWRSRAESASTGPGRARCPRPRRCGRARCTMPPSTTMWSIRWYANLKLLVRVPLEPKVLDQLAQALALARLARLRTPSPP